MLYCPKSAGDTWEKMECLTNKNRIIKAPILVGGWTDEWLGVSKTWLKECSEKMKQIGQLKKALKLTSQAD